MTMEHKSEYIDAISSTKNLPLLDAFLAVVSAGSFTMAGRRTGTDKSLLSRRVRALEESLGVRLLHRTTRKIHVTEAGRALFEGVSAPMEQVARTLVEVSEGDRLQGRVRVATLPYLARSVMVPVAMSVQAEHPGVKLEVLAREELVDLVGQGFDLALRTGKLPDSNLVARRLAEWSYILCATPQWVDTHQPQHPEDLIDHWVLYDASNRADQWEFMHGEEHLELRVGSVLSTDNADVVLQAVRYGAGVGALSPFIADEYLERGELVRVLPQWRIPGRYGVYAVYPHRGLLPRRVQAVIQHLGDRLREAQVDWDRITADPD
ncbi:MAG: LysR family transcriptional regulator [Myxococcota bacterium]